MVGPDPDRLAQEGLWLLPQLSPPGLDPKSLPGTQELIGHQTIDQQSKETAALPVHILIAITFLI